MLEAVSLYYIKIHELNYITGSHVYLEWLMYYTFCVILQCAYVLQDSCVSHTAHIIDIGCPSVCLSVTR